MYEYIVKPGDTLSSIAAYYEVSPEYIVANPRLQPDQLYVGQRILIPAGRYYNQLR